MEFPETNLLPLLEELKHGDVELRFHDGRSIKAHSQKLKMASKSILRYFLEDVLKGDIQEKRRRTDLEAHDAGGHATPGLTVGDFAHCMHASSILTPCRSMGPTKTGWSC